MDLDRIIQELNSRFAAPLQAFYKRRIIVWHDEDREFEDKLADITLTDATIVVLTGTNNFAVKKLLGVDDTAGNYLLYCPFSYEKPEDNWLLDIELYSEEFRADLISIWMDEIGIPQSTALRQHFQTYRKFFNSKDRRQRIAALKELPTMPAKLQLAIMAVLAGLKDAKPGQIMKAVLKSGLNTGENTVYQSFVNYEIDEAFWRMVSQGTGYHQEEEPDLGKLASHIMLTASTRTMRQEFLSGLDDSISMAHQAFCYDFVSEWLHSEDNWELHEIAEYVENEARLPQRFMKLAVEDIVDTECFPCVNEVLLVKLMREISDDIINADVISRTVEKRRTCIWYHEVGAFYDGILQVSNMQAFYRTHAAGFHTVEPKKVWDEYTSKYYLMDTYYRNFHRSYAASIKSYNAELSDLFASVMEKVEGLYTNWFLEQLGDHWSEIIADSLRDFGKVPELRQQTSFYETKIGKGSSKTYVIISDALRYEVAVSLKEQLRRETKSEVNLEAVEGIFPTVTKFGMAALLPHDKLSVEVKPGKTERLAVLVDGQSTEANNRDKILKAKNSKSVALKYKDIIGMKRSDRKALVKGMNVVYIYHDTIDDAGHAEQSIFEACDEAIGELKNLVNIIVKEFNGSRIYITSDHGFLYTYSPLHEDDKVDMTTESEQDIEIGRRYAIMRKGAEPAYLLPVRFLDGNTGYDAFTPRENIRIKMKGGGLNFVHGGISLQEMVVPVIDYRYLRSDSKEYLQNRSKYDTKPVTISILSAGRKLSNMIFSLDFYQKEAVGANREAATYHLYFTDSAGKIISDEALIIADKSSKNEQERIFRCSFNLKSMKYSNTETYYLVIADEDGLQVSREEFQIDIAFAFDDFDFFS